jgi:hypothetical protein
MAMDFIASFADARLTDSQQLLSINQIYFAVQKNNIKKQQENKTKTIVQTYFDWIK